MRLARASSRAEHALKAAVVGQAGEQVERAGAAAGALPQPRRLGRLGGDAGRQPRLRQAVRPCHAGREDAAEAATGADQRQQRAVAVEQRLQSGGVQRGGAVALSPAPARRRRRSARRRRWPRPTAPPRRRRGRRPARRPGRGPPRRPPPAAPAVRRSRSQASGLRSLPAPDQHPHGGAGAGHRVDVEAAVQDRRPLAHRRHAVMRQAVVGLGQHAAAVVGNACLQPLLGRAMHRHLDDGGGGVLERVGHGFAHDLEQAHLVVGVERVGVGDVQRHRHPVVGLEAVGDRPKRRLEALLAKRPRLQRERQLAHRADHRTLTGAGGLDHAQGGLGVARLDRLGRRVQHHVHAGQRLHGAVVQVARQPPALLLLGRHHPPRQLGAFGLADAGLRQQRVHALEQGAAFGGAGGEVGEHGGAGQVARAEADAGAEVEQHQQRVQAAGHRHRGRQQRGRGQPVAELVAGGGIGRQRNHVAGGQRQRRAVGVEGDCDVGQRPQQQAGGGGRAQRALTGGGAQHDRRVRAEQAARLGGGALEHGGAVESGRHLLQA